jgi:hypothetical protein
MPDVQPAQSAEPAQWLLRSAGDWWDLVRYGPPGFDAYVRIAFNPDPQGLDQDGEEPGLRLALGVLAAHTATPTTAYAAVWEGWTTALPPPPAPLVRIPNRTMLLFTGPVGVLRDAPAVAWQGRGRRYQEPHLVWPGDRAWCLACEVDEEIEFTVGCTSDAAHALMETMPGAVRRVVYGEPAPMYRDPA